MVICGQVTESKEETKVVLTRPLSIDGDYRAPNLIHRILSLFNNVRPGSDLTNFKASLRHLFCFELLFFHHKLIFDTQYFFFL